MVLSQREWFSGCYRGANRWLQTWFGKGQVAALRHTGGLPVPELVSKGGLLGGSGSSLIPEGWVGMSQTKGV